MRGFEPPTSRPRTERATGLRYIPTELGEFLKADLSVKIIACVWLYELTKKQTKLIFHKILQGGNDLEEDFTYTIRKSRWLSCEAKSGGLT